MTTYAEDEVPYSSQYAATPPSGLKVATRQRPSDGAAIQSVYVEGSDAGGVVSAANSTETPLAGGASFTGTGESVVDYASIIVTTLSDKASATDGLEFQFSKTGATWVTSDEYTIAAGACKTYSLQPVGPYFRVHYTNGAAAQTSFSLCTQYKMAGGVDRSHRIADDVSGQDDADLFKSILAAERPGKAGTYTNIGATNGGNLKVSVEEQAQPLTVTPDLDLTMSEFGERRVAAPGNRSDVEFIYDKQPLIYDDISVGTGSATHQANGRDVLLAVGGAGVGAVGGLRRHAWVPYTPGSGQEIDITGTFDAANLGGTMYAFLRSTVSGVTTLETVAQADWDALTTRNWQYSQICRMSFQSLKVGRIQFVIVAGGAPTKVCEITNDNERVTGYWQYASLPPYWTVTNDAANTVVEFGYGDALNGIGFRYVMNGIQATATARAICGTVKSQGGVPILDMPGYPFSTPIQATRTVSTTLLPLLSIRVAATFNGFANRAIAIPTGYGVYTDNPVDYVVLYRPSLTNASWAAIDATYSGMEYDVSATAVSGGVRIDTDFLGSGRNVITSVAGLLGRTIMSLGSAATGDILTVAAIRASTSNAAAKAFITWKEIR